MEKNEILSINQYTKILVPASSYKLKEDQRLLIPFTSGEKIGFVNQDGIIVVKPHYSMYYGDCYSNEDYIRVAVDVPYGYIRSGGKVACYNRSLYGLIASNGKIIFESSFNSLVPAIGNKELYTAQNEKFQYGVLRVDGSVVVPFGKYNWIDGYDNGLARVKIGTATNGQKENGNKWGLIDENGNEVLPIEYDDIWAFYDKKRTTTKVVKGDIAQDIVLSDILDVNDIPLKDSRLYDDYGTNYGEYEGYYAQDVEGYSDDVIDDAFDGDPDAYWNID